MLLRHALLQDLPSIADVAAQAMFDDELFAVICPKRHEYFSDYRDGFLRRLQVKLSSPGWVIMVAENADLVVGYGVWERTGDSPSAKRWMDLKDGWKDRVGRKFLSLSNNVASNMHPDRSVDNSRLAEYNAIECFPCADYPDLWLLSSLAVHPDHQRQGIGRKLVEWGLAQALQESVPVGLEASSKGTRLYEQLEFRTINQVDWEGVTITAMLWDKPVAKPEAAKSQ